MRAATYDSRLEMRPISVPQNAPVTAPAAVVLINWFNLMFPCVFHGDHGAAQFDQAFLLHCQQLLANLFRLHLSRERDQRPAPLVAIGPPQNMRLPKKEDGVGALSHSEMP